MKCIKLLVIMFLAVLISAPVWSQSAGVGSLGGTITDQNGGVVPAVSVTAKNVGTGIEYPTNTNEAGFFILPVLPVGVYDLTVTKSGFANYSQKTIQVSVGSQVSLSISLPLASQQATVEVVAETPVVETTRTQVSSTVNDVAIQNLPVNGRNFEDFVLLTPGVTKDNRFGDISFAGQRGTLNSLLVDGADDNNTFFGQTTGRIGSGRAPYQFSQDSVQEFQVNTSSYTAEIGRAGGAVINVVTKSGTNQFHGTAFEYYRDRSLNANDYLNKAANPARPKSPYHFNQFGATLGGPIVKDKMFFFFDYDGQRNTIPNLVSPGINLTTFAFDPNPTTAAQQLAAINYLTPRAASWNRTQNQNVYLGKVDWQITQNNLLSGRWNSQRFTGDGFENGGTQNSLEHTGASLVQTDAFTVSLTSTLKSNLVNLARFQYRKDNEPGLANSANPEATVRQGTSTVLIIGRNNFSPRYTNIKGYQAADNISLVHGTHTFKFGADVLIDRIGNFFPGSFSGIYSFNSLAEFGASLTGTALVTGPTSATFQQSFAGTGTTGPLTQPNMIQFGAFAQDEWRIRPDLTFNYGVRYDIQRVDQPPSTNPAAVAAGFNVGNIHIPKNGPEPRIGIAYSPFGSKKMVLRTGYGIYYGNTPSIMYGTAFSTNGVNVQLLTFSGANIPNYPNTKCGAPVATPSCAAPTGGTAATPLIFVVDPKYKQPFVQQYSTGVEYQVMPNLSVSVSYIGARANHLQRTRDINLPQPITCPIAVGSGTTITGTTTFLYYPGSNGLCPALTTSFTPVLRPAPGFSRVLQFEGTANSTYNGLAVQVTQRFSHNVQFGAAYTFGRVRDDNPDATSVVPGGFDDSKQVQFATNPQYDWSYGLNDQRHRFVGSFVWDLDGYTKGFSRLPRLLIGGWQVSGILTAQSGQPYSGFINTDLNNDGNTRNDLFPAAKRDTFNFPLTVSFDPRLAKSFSVTERFKVQLFAELFNAFNHTNINGVNTTQYTRGNCGTVPTLCLTPGSSFAVPSATVGPRIGQLAAKIIF